MKTRSTPVTGPRYWAGLSIASVFGANMGDFVSQVPHRGQMHGLVPLAAIFAAILMAERRLRVPTEAWYWLAIAAVGTAAPNLGDTVRQVLALPGLVAMGGLVLALAALQAAEKFFAPRHPNELATGLPNTNAYYWIAMPIVGTLGTLCGDYVANELGLGFAWGSVVLCTVLAGALVARGLLGLIGRVPYWGTVTLVWCAGTTVGHYSAGRHGLAVSTAVWAVLMIAVLLAWRAAKPLVPIAA